LRVEHFLFLRIKNYSFLDACAKIIEAEDKLKQVLANEELKKK